jgi:hypothetical protein
MTKRFDYNQVAYLVGCHNAAWSQALGEWFTPKTAAVCGNCRFWQIENNPHHGWCQKAENLIPGGDWFPNGMRPSCDVVQTCEHFKPAADREANFPEFATAAAHGGSR